MGEWRKILPKVLLLLLLLAGMNAVYERFFFATDVEAHSEAAALTRAVQDSADILYLGESSDFTIADEDVDKHSISQMLAQYFPNKRLGTIAKGALHAGNYYDILRSIPSSSPVKTVVVTMNLRSFDATWIHSKLETALQKEMVLLKPGPPLWRRLMLSLRRYEIKTDAERAADARASWKVDTLHFPHPFPYPTVLAWDSAIAMRRWRVHDTLPYRSDAELNLACHYVKTYAFQIDTARNPRIRDFDRLVTLARERDWHLVFSILPENMAQAERLVGKELTFLMRQNRALLRKRYGNLPGVTLVDQLESLPNADFRDQNWTTEHYLEHGRQVVAHGLATAMKPLYPDDCTLPALRPQLGTHIFFNDCEGREIWSQMHTRDATVAHSGSYSSHTEAPDQQFGITFTYPVSKLDTAQLDSIAFSCWVFQARRDHNAAIAWEAGGEKTGYLFDTVHIKPLTQPGEGWQHISFRAALWPQLAEAEIIKVYPYNPSEVDVWFDDIRIQFHAVSVQRHR